MTGSETGPDPTRDFDSDEFRAVLACFATGVAVITAIDGGEAVGLVCNSFTSLSLEPPLVLWCPAKTSTTWPRIRAAGKWAASFLGEQGEETSRRFAASGTDRFTGSRWTPGKTGAPILEGAIAWVECETSVEHDAGDHLIVVGQVVGLGRAPDGLPLVFFGGGYRHLAG